MIKPNMYYSKMKLENKKTNIFLIFTSVTFHLDLNVLFQYLISDYINCHVKLYHSLKKFAIFLMRFSLSLRSLFKNKTNI